MIRTITDFQKVWAYETEMTVKTLRALTDESLRQQVTETGRSLGFLGWHITVTLGEMLALVGLEIDAPAVDSSCPTAAGDIADAYEKAAQSVTDEITKSWNDDTLLIEDEMYGEIWSRGMTLFYLILHQTHHRAQMTILMRQAGLTVPGIYGPAREEWAAMGAPALP